MTTPRVLIIIVTWNKKQYVLDLLTSLTTIDYPTSAIDIVVVDNASSDDTVAAITSTYPQVKLLCNEKNLGGTGGFNTGLRFAFEQSPEHYQYLWLLDNDVLVHHRALTELVALLEAKTEIAVAGSTMMQLDFPWRINEMGAFVNFETGALVLNRHLESVPAWQGNSAEELLTAQVDLSKQLLHCRRYMDVDYVAAASLLIRANVAKQAGLWRDYFIHFDDVEWCLRVRTLGYRVVVSAQSLIWHLSAVAKVPTWVLYYDNRNILDLLTVHGANKTILRQVTRYILKKAVYYHLIGKSDLAQLHHFAIEDFHKGHYGQRELQLVSRYCSNQQIQRVFLDTTIRRILLPWTINLQATTIQESLVQAMQQRPELQVDCTTSPDGSRIYQLPRAHFIFLPTTRLKRVWFYWQMRGRYDLVIQSDYQPIIGLSLLQTKILFINDEGFCQQSPPQWHKVWQAGIQWLRSFL